MPEPGAARPTPTSALLDAADGAARRRCARDGRVQALSRALEAICEVIGAANRYVDAQAPWALRKTDPARMATVL